MSNVVECSAVLPNEPTYRSVGIQTDTQDKNATSRESLRQTERSKTHPPHEATTAPIATKDKPGQDTQPATLCVATKDKPGQDTQPATLDSSPGATLCVATGDKPGQDTQPANSNGSLRSGRDKGAKISKASRRMKANGVPKKHKQANTLPITAYMVVKKKEMPAHMYQAIGGSGTESDPHYIGTCKCDIELPTE